jgi:methyl-accepting chemotaxis protein
MTFIQRFSIACLLAAMIGGATLYVVWQRIDATAAAVQSNDRADRTVAVSDALLAEAIGMETGVRSYIITGDSAKLDLYARNVGQVMLTLNQLSTLSERLPEPLSAERAQQLAFLDTVLDKKITEANQAIQMRREQGIKIAAYIIIRGKAANVMDTVTTVLQSIQRTERAAREAGRNALPNRFREATLPAVYGFAGMILVLFAGLAWAVLAQRQALKPILSGVEKLVLGDIHHRIVASAPEAKPIAAALNRLAEQMRPPQDTAGRS